LQDFGKMLNTEFTKKEIDFMISKMFYETRDIEKMAYNPIISLLESIGCTEIKPVEKQQDKLPDPIKNQEKIEEIPKEEKSFEEKFEENTDKIEEKQEKIQKEPENQHEEKYDDNFDEPEPEKAKPEKKEIKSEKQEEDLGGSEEYADLPEDQMIEIAQKCFFILADTMLQKKMTARKMYTSGIQKTMVNNEETEVIAAEEFIRGIRDLGLKEEFTAIEYACLIKVLAAGEDEKTIKLADLILILEDYGVHESGTGEKPAEEARGSVDDPAHEEVQEPIENNEKQEKEEKGTEEKKGKPLNYSELDELSMVLMLALTEYLIKSNTPLYDLFGENIYQQPVKTKTKQKNIELIDSQNFFSVLGQIGIQTEEGEHENLKKFLSLDPEKHPGKISIKKLKTAIEEFAFNEELRKKAHECYEALVGDDAEGGNPEGQPEYFLYKK